MNPTDHELMHHWRQGDAVAFALLVRRWEDRLGLFVARLLGPRADVDDLCQEVFIRVLGARERYRGEGSFSTWLYRIALNVARDSRRRLSRRGVTQSLGGHDVASLSPGPDVALSRREKGQLVDESLDALTTELREVLVLKHFGELTFAETATVLGLPLSTVKSRMRAALERLGGELRRRGVDSA
jgi:RNA polymerase sigma-70 factor, ECF subfamily